MTMDVVLYSRPGCCLCDEVKEQLRGLQGRAAFEWREINIDEHPDLRKLYQDEIPVVMIGGRKAFKYRLDPEEFLKKLAARR